MSLPPDAGQATPGFHIFGIRHHGPGSARSLVAAHAVEAAAHTPEWRLLVAPLAGTFHADVAAARDDQELNGQVNAGAELGHVDSRGSKHPLLAPCAGHIVEWLVEEADPVSAGQPIARLQPDQAE